MKIFYTIWCALALCGCSTECLRVLQSASYRPRRGYFKVVFSCYFGVLAVLCAFSWFWKVCFPAESVLCLIYTLVALILHFIPRKCPLKFTRRVWRIIAVEFVILLCACWFAMHWWVLFLPLFVFVAWLLCLPIEALINKKYLTAAHRKLVSSGVAVIAITGSFGKTSTKNMLCSLLDGAISPSGSCNTPLGIAKYINSTSFDNVKYLVLEFGARQKGDIAQLCRLFPPTHGVITGVCAQHLSTFKTEENVFAAKMELAECLPPQGFCVLCDESVQFADVGCCKKVVSPQVKVYDMQVSPKGLSFCVVERENKKNKVETEKTEEIAGTEATQKIKEVDAANKIKKTEKSAAIEETDTAYCVRLPQITPYSAQTFAFCATLCLLLQQPLATTVQNATRIEQVAHRMQISFNGKFYIIDDSYNANIRGVASCCEVVTKFCGTKVVISQGIAEGGRLQKSLNMQCGKMLGEVFDVVIALGKNKKQLLAGASSANKMVPTSPTVLQAKNLQHAVELAQAYLNVGDFLVFQNDLPDVANI